MSTHYQAIIIGSGQGSGPLAQAYAKAGYKTALIESTHVGGTCVNEGCTPTKTMVASARVAHVVAEAQRFGVEFKRSSSFQVNMETVRRRKRDIVDKFRSGGERRMKDTPNLDLIMGKARFTAPQSLEVEIHANKTEIQNVTGDKIFINAGCRPNPLTAIKDAHLVHILDSTSIMELPEVPRHLIVLGGGPIGIEFAQMFSRFGSHVSIVARGPRLLPREDPEVSDAMYELLTGKKGPPDETQASNDNNDPDPTEEMETDRRASGSIKPGKQKGIDVYLSATANWFSRVPTGSMILSITTSTGDTKSIFGSHVLNATGRTPNSEFLNLAAAGIETDAAGFIRVDEHLQTTNPAVWALGDITGGPAFTHISYDDSRILKHNLLGPATGESVPRAMKSTHARQVPYTIFTDPPLGRIGHSERSARKAFPNRKIQTATMPMSYVARALETDETQGLMKAVVDGETREILGFACLGIDGGEVTSVVQTAMMGGLGWDQLEQATWAHPLVSEALNNLWAYLK